MLSFKQFSLLNESIRQGLPHVTTMDHGQFKNLILDKKVHLHDVTEKTDGQSMKFGHDEHGFYTQSTGSGDEKMRKPEDYHARARARAEKTGKEYNSTAPDAFAHIHRTLQSNTKLTKHLADTHKKTGQEVSVRGESFYKPWGRPGDKPGEVKFVGTSYDTSHIGKVGKFVIHSKLPENQHHDVEHFKKHLSDEHINFDDDKIDHKPSHVDVKDEHKEFHSLNHELLSARTTKTNKADKEAETEKFNKVKQKVSDKVDAHVKSIGITPKWGSGSEGAVIHPKPNHPMPRFKVTSDSFRSYKKSEESKNLIKR